MPDSSSYQDRGWAWLVVVGAFISHYLTCGFEKGYSVLYVEIIEKYHTSAALAAGLSGFSAAIRLLLAPISVYLSTWLSEQIVVISGGILCCIGLAMTSLSNDFYGVAVGYGVIFGFGLTLVYTPSLTICTTYFKKRRSTAISLSLSGCGFAALTMPYLIVYLLDVYAYDGAVLILASISLHYCVAGAFYRDTSHLEPKTTINTTRNETISKPVDFDNQTCIGRAHQLIIKRIRSRACRETLKNPWLLLFLFSFCFNMMGSGPVTTLLIHHAENLGYRRMISVQLLAIEGVAQIFIRIFTGLVFDHSKVRPYRGIIWAVTITFSAVIILLIAFAKTMWFLSLLMCLRGIMLAVYISQQAVIAADMCENSPETLKQTIGFTQIGKGVGVLLGSWFSGMIRDVTQEYRPAFLFLSGMQFIGSLAAGAAVLKVHMSNNRLSDSRTPPDAHHLVDSYQEVSASDISEASVDTECLTEEHEAADQSIEGVTNHPKKSRRLTTLNVDETRHAIIQCAPSGRLKNEKKA
ncbi:Monocarboxylate transporter [Paragonimus heterotremus]|uniref:Monocarboxylate transporter n=1 Tax=Paragonimus heterotremus TaxID=100268 RepID=A0A8J4WJA8_9TREM|nr:Monocarboxylate transporter [Paragonimus heterotremus]